MAEQVKAYLIEASISDDEEQASVVGLYTVLDQYLDPLVDFLLHFYGCLVRFISTLFLLIRKTL